VGEGQAADQSPDRPRTQAPGRRNPETGPELWEQPPQRGLVDRIPHGLLAPYV